jgi:hypothetical protein
MGLKKKNRAQAEYNYLLENNMLLDLHPDMTGVWETDMKTYILQFDYNWDIINNMDVDLD